MSDVADKLREARALIKRGWCQGVPARDAKGNHVDLYGDEACKWCAWGAVRRVTDSSIALAFLNQSCGKYSHIVTFNEVRGRQKRQVLAAFDRAIELAEKSA